MARVFATCDIGTEALELVRRAGHELSVFEGDEAPGRAAILAAVQSGVAGLVTTLRDPIDEGVLEAGRGRLKVVAQDAVGLDNVDVAAASARGILVTNTADMLTEATAEFALFLMGEVSRKLPASETLVRDGRWGSWHPSRPFLGTEVTGKSVAIVGCGRIGKAFAGECLGLDMDLLLVASRIDDEWLGQVRAIQALRQAAGFGRRLAAATVCTLDEALERADYVSLHVPLVKQGPRATLGLIGEAQLKRMRSQAFLVNTARGPVVDEAALVQALRERWIAGAALDVFEREPLPMDSPLRAPELADRVRLHHHFGSGTHETRLATDPAVGMAGRCVAGLLDGLSDAPTGRYAVNARAAP